GRGRDAISRRNRRHADGGTDASVAGIATGRIHHRWRQDADQDRRAHRRCKQQGSAYSDSAGPVPGRSVLPPERGALASAAAPRADRGSARSDPALLYACGERWTATEEARHAGAGAAEAASLAR